MIEAEIYIQPKDKVLLWKTVLKTTVKGKEYKKETSGIATTKEELRDPFDTLLAMLKKKNVTINLKSNYNTILNFAKNYNGETGFKTELDKEMKTSFEEEVSFAEENIKDYPKYIKTRYKDIKEEDSFLTMVKANTLFLKTYLYFLEKPEDIFDIPLFVDMKRKGFIKEEMQMEDIFSTIEETMNQGV